MSEHLWPLLRLQADTDEELKEAYRQVYLQTYVRNVDGQKIEISDWQGKRIFFNAHPNFFEHAFTEHNNYRSSYGVHSDKLDKRRARCLLWIKEVLRGEVGTIERRHQTRKDDRGRLRKRRSLIVVEERYVVVLEERKGGDGLDFISAFPANEGYIKNLRAESTLMETKKPQS